MAEVRENAKQCHKCGGWSAFLVACPACLTPYDTPEQAAARALCRLSGDPFCERCRCCGMDWEVCPDCDGLGDISEEDDIDGYTITEHCALCETEGGWYVCTCDENGKHARLDATGGG